MNALILGHDQLGRRSGLSRGGFRGPSLLQSIKTPANEGRSTMEAKTVLARKKTSIKQEPESKHVAEQEDINRLPDRSSDEDDISADIHPTAFVAGSQNAEKQKANDRDALTGSTRNASTNRTRTRFRRGKSSPSSSITSGSPKRKSREDPVELGKSMVDDFGVIKEGSSKKPRKKYGTSKHSSYGKKASTEIFKMSGDILGLFDSI